MSIKAKNRSSFQTKKYEIKHSQSQSVHLNLFSKKSALHMILKLKVSCSFENIQGSIVNLLISNCSRITLLTKLLFSSQ